MDSQRRHLHYIAYGLPVLVPAWRRHMDLLRGSVPYEEQGFRAVVDTLSHEKEWRRLGATSLRTGPATDVDGGSPSPLETALSGLKSHTGNLSQPGGENGQRDQAR